ncbi:hypothetical protein [Tropicimonas sp. S265A]|uniref:hypothetical protein n=1 Tax=Tropicimonas sp. S265A TaxID=3415134 RepID=UPI003C7CF3BC
MPDRTKIATCSYCGARSMLVPTARDGHELACSSCGAPIHELKWLKTREPGHKKLQRSTPHAPKKQRFDHDDRSGYKRRKKRRKPLWQKALGEAADLIEDIFD